MMLGWFRKLALMLAILGLGLTSGPALAATAHSPVCHIAKNATYGKILVTSKGMTLYYYTPDKPNKSTCTGGCAKIWPPAMLPAGMKQPPKVHGLKGTLGSIPRGHGRQLTYDKKPLYTYASDKKSGQALGQGIGKVWYVVKVH